MTMTSSPLASTHLGAQLARRWFGALATSMGLLVVLTITARITPNIPSHGLAILASTIFVLWTRG